MTIHSSIKNKCKYCDLDFVPIPEAPNCPKCECKSEVVFPDFVRDTIASARFNISAYGMFLKMWLVITVGDQYYLKAFQFLRYVCSELKISEYDLLDRKFSKAQIDLLVAQFLGIIKYGDQPYWRHGWTTYLSLLLQKESSIMLQCL